MISSIPKWVSTLFGNNMRPNVKVLETIYINPNIKKVQFQGDISKWNFQIGFASVVRVSETEFRNYTIYKHDKENGVFEIIFHIHNNGIGSNFVDDLKTGDELFISAPRGKKLYNPSDKQQFFFGDETTLGVASALFSILKQHNTPFQFYFELDEVNKDVPQLLGLENYTTFIKNKLFRDEKWIKTLPLFQQNEWTSSNFILIGNVKSVQAFRKVLKEKTKGNVNSQGYWLEGKKGL